MADRESTNGPTAEASTKRKRPWRRRVVVVVGCLLAGAIINVLVAWACVFIADDGNAGWLQLWVQRGDHGVGIRSFPGWVEYSTIPTLDDPQKRDTLPRWSQINELARGYRSDRFRLVEVECGLPFKSLCGSMVGTTDSSRTWTQKFTIIAGEPRVPGRPPALPYRPLWLGFVANTVLYGMLVWVLVGIPLVLFRRAINAAA